MTDPQKPALVDNMLLLRKEDFEDLLDRAAERAKFTRGRKRRSPL